MRFLKIFSFTILGLMVLIHGLIWYVSEPLPAAEASDEAEILTDSIFKAINKEAYDTLSFISWEYPRGHRFEWNKKDNHVTAYWDDYQVSFYPEDLTGKAIKNGSELKGVEAEKAINKAWKLFANDSFWLVAPFKLRDPGTVRSVVEVDGKKALLVTYLSGGVTPGDSYLWILDEYYRPVAWKMWVKIIPVGGLTFSWDNWQIYQGVWFAPQHQGVGAINITLKINEIK